MGSYINKRSRFDKPVDAWTKIYILSIFWNLQKLQILFENVSKDIAFFLSIIKYESLQVSLVIQSTSEKLNF